jgi:hypothetical protein
MSYEDIDQMLDEIVERDMVSVTLYEALSFIAASYKVKYSLMTEEEIKKKYLSIRGELH